MDFSKEQIKTLQAVVGQVVDNRIRLSNDILLQEIKALEHRVKSELRQEIKQAKDETIEAVSEMLDSGIVPRLDHHEQRLTKLEVKIV
ncbi:MAG TPA: hypothetical protein PLK06_03510 [bacterium]|nr:hypothetical protein [bacterium]